MKKLKALALLMCLIMLASCFAGCSGVGSSETTKAPGESKGETPEGTTEDDGVIPTITIGLPQNAKTEDYETNKFTKHLEEKVGVNLDFVTFSTDATERNTQFAAMVSANEKLPDILWSFGFSDAQRAEYGQDGYLIDLTDYLANGENYQWALNNMIDTEYIPMMEQYGRDLTTGAMYGAPYLVYSPNTVPFNVQINSTWLEAVGEEIPTTVDELYTVLQKFAATDINGNGQKDEIPAVGRYNGSQGDIVQWIINAYVFINNSYLYNVTDGEIWLPHTTDEYRQALIFIKKLVDEGLLYAGTFTIKSSGELMTLFTPSDGISKAGIVAGQPDLITEANNMMVGDYDALAPLKGVTELGGYQPYSKPKPSFNTHITSDCENPDLAWEVIDEMYSEESFVIMRYGSEGVGWEWVPEGSTGTTMWGTPTKINILDNSLWSSQNNENWHTLAATFGNYADYNPVVDTTATDFTTVKAMLFQDFHRKWADFGNKPAEAVHAMLYTADESEVISEYEATIKNFIIEQTALFCTGILNPSSDADWQNFVKTIDDMGVENLLKTVQSAYDRMNK